MKEKRLIRFDWAMKRLLRNRANFGILEGLLSELLREDIKIDHLLESESNKQSADNKLNRVDILAKDARGALIIIEIQGNAEYDYLMRMAFGTAKLMVDNSYEGMEYYDIKKIISLNIVYFNLGDGEDYIYHGTTTFKGLHIKDMLGLSAAEQKLLKAKKIEEIYPEYYVINVEIFDNVSKNTLDEWVNFLKNEEIKDGTKAKGLKQAKETLDKMKLSKEERLEYEKDLRTWYDSKHAWEQQFKTGKEEGKEEGIKIGEANKEKYAEEKAQQKERQTKIEMAKKALKKGMATDDIADLTGLTEDEIKTIQP